MVEDGWGLPACGRWDWQSVGHGDMQWPDHAKGPELLLNGNILTFE